MKLNTLKKQAKEAATFRGHKLGRFNSGLRTYSAMATCKVCSATVTVNERPQPNDIDMSGNALAVNCPVR